MPKLTCDGCSVEFERPKPRQVGYKAYHSTECQRLNQTYTTGRPYSVSGAYSEKHECAGCSTEFYPHHPSVRYCNDTCKRRSAQKRTADRWKDRNVVGDSYSAEKRREYKAHLLTQQFNCAICSRGFSEFSLQNIHVDHDHLTGKIRGLLCFKCNAGLGQFGDNVDNLRAAIAYLNRTDGVD